MSYVDVDEKVIRHLAEIYHLEFSKQVVTKDTAIETRMPAINAVVEEVFRLFPRSANTELLAENARLAVENEQLRGRMKVLVENEQWKTQEWERQRSGLIARIEEMERLRDTHLDDLKECAEKIAELEAAQFIPGEWKCDECGYRVSKRILNAADANVYSDPREDVEGCPNDGLMMRRVTWKEDVQSADRAVEFWYDKARKLEDKYEPAENQS